jgi:hypothetical protein
MRHSEAVEILEHAHGTIEIVQDMDPIDPRENDNLGTMLCYHRRYDLGDSKDRKEYWPNPEDAKALAEREDVVWLPLYMYDHSGITISTAPFSCPWDSGQLGIIFITKDDAVAEFGDHQYIVRSSGHVPSKELFNYYQGGGKWKLGAQDTAMYFRTAEDAARHFSLLGLPAGHVAESISWRQLAVRALQAEVKEYDQYLTGDVYGWIASTKDGSVVDSSYGYFGLEYAKEAAWEDGGHALDMEQVNRAEYERMG